MRMLRQVTALSSALVLISSIGSGAIACECGWVDVKTGKLDVSAPPPPLTQDEMSRYPTVFEGLVRRLDLDSIPHSSCEGCVTKDVVVTFTVSKVWRGKPVSEYQVRTPFGIPACEYRFRLGERYLVYVEEGGPDFNYGISRCSRTKLRSAATDELRLLEAWAAKSEAGRSDP